jgi:recombination protein RecR
MKSPDAIRRLVKSFSRLPGIGEKTATRLAYFMINAPGSLSEELAGAILEVQSEIKLCDQCCSFTDSDICKTCTDETRDSSIICVVDSVQGQLAIESTGEYRGRYHVLHGVLSPLDGIGPEELRIGSLIKRLKSSVEELMIAVTPTVEGEATAIYLQRICAPLGLRVTRLASGIPMGADLEFTDPLTLSRAIEGRTVFN